MQGNLEHAATTDKSWTDQAGDAAKRVLGWTTAFKEHASDDEWEDLASSSATSKTGANPEEDTASKGTKQNEGMVGENKSLLGMIEQLRFMPSAGSREVQGDDRASGSPENAVDRHAADRDKDTKTNTDTSKAGKMEYDRGCVMDKVRAAVDTAEHQLSDVAGKVYDALGSVKESVQSATHSPSSDPVEAAAQPDAKDTGTGEDEIVLEHSKGKVASSVRAVQEQLEHAMMKGEEGFLHSNASNARDDGENNATSSEEFHVDIERLIDVWEHEITHSGREGGHKEIVTGAAPDKVKAGVRVMQDQFNKGIGSGKDKSTHEGAGEIAVSEDKGGTKSFCQTSGTLEMKRDEVGGTSLERVLQRVDDGIYTLEDQLEVLALAEPESSTSNIEEQEAKMEGTEADILESRFDLLNEERHDELEPGCLKLPDGREVCPSFDLSHDKKPKEDYEKMATGSEAAPSLEQDQDSRSIALKETNVQMLDGSTVSEEQEDYSDADVAETQHKKQNSQQRKLRGRFNKLY